MDIAGTLAHYEQYKYLIIFLLAIPEGTVLPLTCGFLATMGLVNPAAAYALIVAGDAVMDSFLYGFGRMGTPLIARFGLKIGLTLDRANHARQRFEAHRLKVLAASKFMHGPGTVGLMMAGILRIAYPMFFASCFFVSVCRIGLLFAIGYFFGHAYVEVSAYARYYAAGLLLVILVAIIVSHYRKHP